MRESRKAENSLTKRLFFEHFGTRSAILSPTLEPQTFTNRGQNAKTNYGFYDEIYGGFYGGFYVRFDGGFYAAVYFEGSGPYPWEIRYVRFDE